MVGDIVEEGWSAGKFYLSLSNVISRTFRQAIIIIDALHGSLLAFSVKVQPLHEVVSAHYGHDNAATPREFKIIVAMLDELPDVLIKCGWLLGVEFPKKGGIEGVKILWFTENLDQHGEVVCPEVGCKRTDHDGIATLVFKRKQELDPYGMGPEYSDDGFVTAVALYQSKHRNYFGAVSQILTPKYALTRFFTVFISSRNSTSTFTQSL